IIGKVVLAHQLYELGQIDEPHLSFNTDAAMIIEEMYHDLGDTIALQYGGSHLVNTVQTYRRNNNWRSHSRDVVEALRRYYSNSLLDMERQEAITMFLERSLLEECKGDDCVGVNNLSPLGSPIANQLSTLTTSQWWTTLGDEGMDEVGKEKADSLEKDSKDDTSHRDDYWNEYYRPHEYTSLDSLFVGNLNSTASLHPNMDIQNMPSPFVDRSAKTARTYSHVRRVQQEPQWLKSETDEYTDPTRVSRQEIYDKLCAKTVQPQVILPIGIGGWITDGVSSPLQEPQVSRQELEEYKKYVHQFDDLKKWIVQPSTKLYADVHNAGVRTPERGSAKSLAHAEPPATTSKIKMDTGGLGVLALERQRSQTPTPGMQAHSLMSLSATLPARPGSRKITPLEILQRSPSLRASGRQRANTSSVERGSLWGLWPNVPSLGSKRSSLVGQQGSGGGDFAAMLQRRASHGQLAKHD
ncbi:phosphatidylinositol-3,5-bisphosphate 5-phosphatase, partial [Linderina pennispora]